MALSGKALARLLLWIFHTAAVRCTATTVAPDACDNLSGPNCLATVCTAHGG